jgi:hypothetical protein
MLLHVIWGFVDERPAECPTFSVTGVMLQWADQAPALVRQGRFLWRHDAWEADIELSRGVNPGPAIVGQLRLRPEVLQVWTRKSLNPRSEAARQLRQAILDRGWTGELGVITLGC